MNEAHLLQVLRENPCAREALFWVRTEDDAVRCNLCERRCVISPGNYGFCRTRVNVGGRLFTLEYGNISSISANPIEKKPLFHFYPGTKALTIGSYSCNFTCPWCQNWEISKTEPSMRGCNFMSAESFVRKAEVLGCRGTSISFNEPTLMLEYALDVFRYAHERGLYNTFVTNGYMSEEALRMLIENGLDAVNVDMKGCEDSVRVYCGADVEKIWRNIRIARDECVHVEVTSLLIQGVNDDENCLRDIANRIKKEAGENTPWHITRYYPAYNALECLSAEAASPTPVEIMEKAWRIGKEAGLNYVYLGNIPGHRYENTYCHACGEMLIRRYVFDVIRNYIKEGKCPKCGAEIPVVDNII